MINRFLTLQFFYTHTHIHTPCQSSSYIQSTWWRIYNEATVTPSHELFFKKSFRTELTVYRWQSHGLYNLFVPMCEASLKELNWQEWVFQSFTKQPPTFLDFIARPILLIWAVPEQRTGICSSLLSEQSLVQLWPGTFVTMPLIARCCLRAQHGLGSIPVGILHVASLLWSHRELQTVATAILWQPATESWAHFVSKSSLLICMVLS